MARIAGVNLPTNKRVVIALQYIHGIGPAKAREIVSKVGIDDARRVNQLTDQEVLQIREAIDRDYLVEGDLRRETAVNIKRLMDLACYRGLRHRTGLPVSGDADLAADFLGVGRADAVDVLQRDLDALLGRDVDAGDPGHGVRS